MVCLKLKLGVAGWKAQTNPLRYGGFPQLIKIGHPRPLFRLFSVFLQTNINTILQPSNVKKIYPVYSAGI